MNPARDPWMTLMALPSVLRRDISYKDESVAKKSLTAVSVSCYDGCTSTPVDLLAVSLLWPLG